MKIKRVLLRAAIVVVGFLLVLVSFIGLKGVLFPPHSLKFFLNHNYGDLRIVNSESGETKFGFPEDNRLFVEYLSLLLGMIFLEGWLLLFWKHNKSIDNNHEK